MLFRLLDTFLSLGYVIDRWKPLSFTNNSAKLSPHLAWEIQYDGEGEKKCMDYRRPEVGPWSRTGHTWTTKALPLVVIIRCMELTYVLGVIVSVGPTMMHDHYRVEMEKKGEEKIELHRIIFKFLTFGHLTFVNFFKGIKIMCIQFNENNTLKLLQL